MTTVKWDKLNSVGNSEIDQQHKMWIEIYDNLERQLLSTTPHNSTDFQLSLLKELVDFTKKHFDAEEEIMQQHDYPSIVMHRRMHKDFHQKIYDLYREVLAGDIVLNSEIISMIRSWFMSHTSSEDKKAFLYINNQK